MGPFLIQSSHRVDLDTSTTKSWRGFIIYLKYLPIIHNESSLVYQTIFNSLTLVCFVLFLFQSEQLWAWQWFCNYVFSLSQIQLHGQCWIFHVPSYPCKSLKLWLDMTSHNNLFYTYKHKLLHLSARSCGANWTNICSTLEWEDNVHEEFKHLSGSSVLSWLVTLN